MKRAFALLLALTALTVFAAPAFADANVMNKLNQYGGVFFPATLVRQDDSRYTLTLSGGESSLDGGGQHGGSTLSGEFFTLGAVTDDSFEINHRYNSTNYVMYAEDGKIVRVDVKETFYGGVFSGTYAAPLPPPPSGDGMNLPLVSALLLAAAAGLILLRRKRAA